MFKTYFQTDQLCFLVPGLVLLVLSLVFHVQDRNKVAVLLLFLGSLSLAFFATLLDPFLNAWDERFHALVAKNMMDTPLKPMLYADTVVDMAYDRWDRASVWLHKQPLFMWQIALSFKLFGVSEWSLRLPSALMSSCLVLMAYRSGKLLVNERVGFVTGFLFATSFYMVELISGRQGMDHNDIAFIFYVSASIWAFLEYHYGGKKRYLMAVGLFTGAAILCKWMVGLLAFWIWGIYNLVKKDWRGFSPLLLALMACLFVFVPWQIWILTYYPEEAAFEYAFNTRHFTEVLSGHGGGWDFHFKKLPVLYGWLATLCLPFAGFALFKMIRERAMKIPILSAPLLVFLFFSLAQTKIQTFTFVVALFVFMALACLIVALTDWLRNKSPLPNWLSALLVFVVMGSIGFLNLKIEKLQLKHTHWKKENKQNYMAYRAPHNKQIFMELKNELPENTLLFNVSGRHYVDAMFYTGFPSYGFIPSEKQYLDLKKKGNYTFAVFQKKDSIPNYLKLDPHFRLIEKKLRKFD